MKYYEVCAKCGHVGRNYYIRKLFYVKEASKKSAAAKIRATPRVKHHHKYAIEYVKEITLKEYVTGRNENNIDPYFKAKSKQEQRTLHAVDPDEIIAEAIELTYKRSHKGQYLKNMELEKEFYREKRGGFIDYD